MVLEENWLSLKVLPKTPARLLISVPKKVVPLATQRNRLKRLIRETVRLDRYFDKQPGVYHFRVGRFPGPLGLEEVRRVVHQLQPGLGKI